MNENVYSEAKLSFTSLEKKKLWRVFPFSQYFHCSMSVVQPRQREISTLKLGRRKVFIFFNPPRLFRESPSIFQIVCNIDLFLSQLSLCIYVRRQNSLHYRFQINAKNMQFNQPSRLINFFKKLNFLTMKSMQLLSLKSESW